MSYASLKILMYGSADSGKSSLLMRFIKSRFDSDYKLTVGVDILSKEVELEDGRSVILRIWDLGGQERFSFIKSTFYKGAKGALLVFNLSQASSLDYIKAWREDVKKHIGDIPFILIGNKLELLKETGEVIDRNECREYAERQGGIYIETSSAGDWIVDESILRLVKMILDKSETS